MSKFFKRISFAVVLTMFLNLCLGCVFVCRAEDENTEKMENTENNVLELNAPSAILIEQATGSVLYQKNPDEKLPLASVTKVMTMLLVMEAIDSGKISFQDIVTGSENAKSMGGSTIFLDAGEQISVYDLMKGVAVASGNDAAVALAEFVSGSEEGFVELMNNRAKELNMTNTHFVNPNGLDADGHYSSARDISIMSRELLKHEKIFEFTTIWIDSLRDGKFQLANTNKLIRFYDGANGIKTGSTSVAKNCISASAKRDDMQLIAVVMAAPTSPQRFEDAKKLLDFGFANYSINKAAVSGECVGETEVLKGVSKTVKGVLKDNFSVLTKKGEQGDIRYEAHFDENIFAPVKIGDKIGEAKVFKGDKHIGGVDIVSAENAEKLTYMAMTCRLLRKWITF